ncbi:MAG TPA: stage II sporulation protein R [Clostridia bacterium]|nr:stage II sporulation protein R [Clostridia bacterium]
MSKKTALLILTALMISMLLGYQYLEANKTALAYNQDNLIRFHVVANSDSDVDQALKLKVRDVIVKAMTNEFAGIGDIRDARIIANEDIKYIEGLARQEVEANGKGYPVRVYYDRFPFPTKTYDTLTLPAGEYEAVKVVIGEGAGSNWWCVLFPPLCFANTGGQELAMNDRTDFKLAGNKSFAENTGENLVQVEYRLKIVDLIHDKFFSGEGKKGI